MYYKQIIYAVAIENNTMRANLCTAAYLVDTHGNHGLEMERQ